MFNSKNSEIKSIPGKPSKNMIECPETIEPPKKLDYWNVIYWSTTYKRLEGMGAKTTAIRHKALRFLRDNCIEYDKENKCYLCKPIKGYNSNTYKMFPIGDTFNCTCQFHNKVVVKEPNMMCSHVLALLLMLKIWNYNRNN